MTVLKRILLMTLTLSLALLCGCWDSKELDTIFIVIGMGLDTAPSADEVDLSVQVGTVGQDSTGGMGSNEHKHVLMKAQNRSVYGGVNDLRANSTRSLFLEHNQVLLFGRELAERGLEPHLDFFTREMQTRMEVWMVVASDRTDDILDMKINVEKTSGEALSSMLKNRSSISEALAPRLIDFLSKLLDGTTSATLPVVGKTDIGGEETLLFKELAVFKADKMVGTLDDKETWGFILADGDVHSGSVYVETADGVGELKINHSRSQIEPTLFQDGSVRVDLKIETELIVGDVKGFSGDSSNTFENMLAGAASDEIRSLIMRCVDATSALKADVFGIGEMLMKKYPAHWPQIRDSWDERYPAIDWRIEIDALVVSDGRITSPLTIKEGKQNGNMGS